MTRDADEALESFPEEVRPPQIYQVDEDLTSLQAVMEWAGEGNPPGQRVAHILSIPAAAAESSLEEARNVLLPLLTQLAFDDHPDVKQATAEVLGPLGPVLASKDPELKEAGGSSDVMDLLVLAHRLLQDAERGVQEAAASSVAEFAALLTPEHRQEHLSAVVDALMLNYEDEQMQECAVDLLTKVVVAAGPADPKWCQQCALPRVFKLALHKDYNIRLHAVAALVQLAGCLAMEERAGPLLSAFADLCADQVWSVRQDCAAQLVALASHLPRQAVRERVLPLWRALGNDVSAWVQTAARRQAGPLLATLHPEDCTTDLLDAFVAAASGPAILTESCAHYLPAVLQNLGMQRWPQLREAVTVLAVSEHVSVRAALAESMHRLAALTGPEAVAADLLAVMQSLSADEQPAVAAAQAANISSLLAALPPGARLSQLGFLARMHPEGSGTCGQWRMRLLVAEQLAEVASLLDQRGLAEVLLPATLRLCEDPVAAVRQAAARQLGAMAGVLLALANDHGQNQRQAGGSSQQGKEEDRTVGSPALVMPQQEQEEDSNKRAQAVEAASPTLASQQQRTDAAAGAPAAASLSDDQPQVESDEAAAVARQKHQQPDHYQEQQKQEQLDQESNQEGLPGDEWAAELDSAAVVQQIAQHMVELQRSSSHRARQTYLAFCTALLLPQRPLTHHPQQQQYNPEAVRSDAVEQAAVAAVSQQPESAEEVGSARCVESTSVPPHAATRAAMKPPLWPQLPKAVANSGTVLGLLEGAVALSADPVPNVRLGVARLLAAICIQQPHLAAASPRVTAGLASLAADPDGDVRQAVSAGMA